MEVKKTVFKLLGRGGGGVGGGGGGGEEGEREGQRGVAGSVRD